MLARMSAFGSTAHTRLPFSRSCFVKIPVPAPTSATAASGVSPASVYRYSMSACG